MKTLALWTLCVGCILSSSCSSPTNTDAVNDVSLADPGAYLISVHDSVDNDSLKRLPTVVAFHGFSASTYEWWEYRDHSDSVGSARVSLPLLGGHGRTYEDFRKATWEDWQAEPLAEYKALSDRGYSNLNVVCSSTGCPLLIDAIKHGWFADKIAPHHVVMIDPIIFPSAKVLTLVDIAGLVLNSASTECTDTEKSYWFCTRPVEALNQLQNVLTYVRGELEDGVQAPDSTQIIVFKSIHDGSADPVSALAIYQGLRNGDGSHIEVQMVKSSLHVFTRGAGRAKWTTDDEALQIKTFTEMDSIFNAR